jgi:hypothetical protein
MERQAIYGLMEKADRIAAEAMAINREKRIKHDLVRKLSRDILDFLPEISIYFFMALEKMGEERRTRVESELAGFLEERLDIRPKWVTADRLAKLCRVKDREIGDLEKLLADLLDERIRLNQGVRFYERQVLGVGRG